MPKQSPSNLILTELSALREDVNKGFRDHGERLAKVETNIGTILTDGKIKQYDFEDRIRGLEKWRFYTAGIATAAISAVEVGWHWLLPGHKG